MEEGCLSERDGSEFYDRAGLSYPSSGSPITVVCETASHTYFFHAGIFYCTGRLEFHTLVTGVEPIGGDYALSRHNKSRLKPTEVEFVLGIFSSIDPSSSWSVIGMDLLEFVIKSRKNINRWSVEVASLLLTQQMLKKYAKGLYVKIFEVLADGAWSRLPDSVSTDDAVIARFAGHLFGHYRTEELMDRMVRAHRSISFQFLKRFSAVATHQLKTQRKVGWHRKQVELLRRSFHKVGVEVGDDEIRSYLEEVKIAAEEIQNIVRILLSDARRIVCN